MMRKLLYAEAYSELAYASLLVSVPLDKAYALAEARPLQLTLVSRGPPGLAKLDKARFERRLQWAMHSGDSGLEQQWHSYKSLIEMLQQLSHDQIRRRSAEHLSEAHGSVRTLIVNGDQASSLAWYVIHC